jgi:hypothetical protein
MAAERDMGTTDTGKIGIAGGVALADLEILKGGEDFAADGEDHSGCLAPGICGM